MVGLFLVATAVFWFGADALAGTIRLVPQLFDGPQQFPSVNVTWLPGTSDLAEIDLFDFSLLYDSSRLKPAYILPAEGAEAEWRVDFINKCIDTIIPGHSFLWIRGERLAPATDTAPEAVVLARVVFRPEIPESADERTPVSFYWNDCRANFLYSESDLALAVAAKCYDPDSADITSLVTPPPTVSGLCDSCLEVLQYGSAIVTRSLVFQSARLALDIATDAAPEPEARVPRSPLLYQNYPNPFNGGTTIRFESPRAGRWRIEIFSIDGRQVRQFTGFAGVGTHAVHWDGLDRSGSPCASGIYLYRLTAGEAVATRRMALLR